MKVKSGRERKKTGGMGIEGARKIRIERRKGREKWGGGDGNWSNARGGRGEKEKRGCMRRRWVINRRDGGRGEKKGSDEGRKGGWVGRRKDRGSKEVRKKKR